MVDNVRRFYCGCFYRWSWFYSCFLFNFISSSAGIYNNNTHTKRRPSCFILGFFHYSSSAIFFPVARLVWNVYYSDPGLRFSVYPSSNCYYRRNPWFHGANRENSMGIDDLYLLYQSCPRSFESGFSRRT